MKEGKARKQRNERKCRGNNRKQASKKGSNTTFDMHDATPMVLRLNPT